MSIAVLTQVHDELRRLAIAGSNLAAGDFRLKKLVPPLEASAAKAPVFGKVAQAVQKVLDSSPQDSAEALLELSTLVSAILYTQGETGIEGELAPIETTDIGVSTSAASAQMLKPLIESLTTTGSGREEIIRDAFERGVFKDLRLVRVAVKAIDDPYPPIADFIADQVLPMYGKAIYDDLRAGYNPKAKGGQVRRLRLLHRLDPERTHELVEQALESGSPDMKVAALACLEGRQEMLSYLLEQARAKSADVRRAAYRSMAQSNEKDVVECLTQALSGADVKLAAGAASQNRSPKLLAFLLEETGKELQEVEKLGAKNKKQASKSAERLYHLLLCLESRNDKQTVAFLKQLFERRGEIGQWKTDVGGEQINRLIAGLLVKTGDKASLALVADSHATLAPEVLDWALLAAAKIRKPKEIYDAFAPYYLAPSGKKKHDAAAARRERVRELLLMLALGRTYAHYRYGDAVYSFGDGADLREFIKDLELDPRWLDAAIESDDLQLVQVLARAKHKPTWEYLSKWMDAMLKKRDFDYQCSHVLETMIRTEHPQVTEYYVATLKKIADGRASHYAYWLARLIPSLPKSAGPQIEAVLPTMNDKVVNQIAPFIAELQAKA
jgi:hypothetical protein